jgi:uncharacterized protein YkwD
MAKLKLWLSLVVAVMALTMSIAVGSAVAAPWGAPAAENAQLLELVNQVRAEHGLGPLAYNQALGHAAQSYAETLAATNHWSHTGPDGSTMQDRAAWAGYTRWLFLAENLAAGYEDPATIVNQWMNSKGHRDSILAPEATEAGVGHAFGPRTRHGHYWAMEFGNSW